MAATRRGAQMNGLSQQAPYRQSANGLANPASNDTLDDNPAQQNPASTVSRRGSGPALQRAIGGGTYASGGATSTPATGGITGGRPPALDTTPGKLPGESDEQWMLRNWQIGYGDKPFDSAYWNQARAKANPTDYEYWGKRMQGWQAGGADSALSGPYAGQGFAVGKTPSLGFSMGMPDFIGLDSGEISGAPAATSAPQQQAIASLLQFLMGTNGR